MVACDIGGKHSAGLSPRASSAAGPPVASMSPTSSVAELRSASAPRSRSHAR